LLLNLQIKLVLQAPTQGDCDFAMTAKTKRTDVFQIAFAAALDHGNNMVGIPEAFARSAPQPPVGE
jgi:hypothetical protein